MAERNLIDNPTFKQLASGVWRDIGSTKSGFQITRNMAPESFDVDLITDNARVIYKPLDHWSGEEPMPAIGRDPDKQTWDLSGRRIWAREGNFAVDQFRSPEAPLPITWRQTVETTMPQHQYDKLIYGVDFGVIKERKFDDHGVEIT